MDVNISYEMCVCDYFP